MPKFSVQIREVYISHRIVKAENAERAKSLASDIPETLLEYSHTLDRDLWTVEEME